MVSDDEFEADDDDGEGTAKIERPRLQKFAVDYAESLIKPVAKTPEGPKLKRVPKVLTMTAKIATIIIGNCWRTNPQELDKGFEAYEQVKSNDPTQVDIHLIDALVNACRRCNEPKRAAPLWQDVISGNFVSETNPLLLSQFSCCADEGDSLELATDLLNAIKDPEQKIYHSPRPDIIINLLRCFIRHSRHELVQDLCDHTRPTIKNTFDAVNFSNLMRRCVSAESSECAQVIHKVMAEMGLAIENLKLVTQTLVLHSNKLNVQAVKEMYDYYQAREFPFDNYNYSVFFILCRKVNDPELGKFFHKAYVSSKNTPDVHLIDNLIYMYTSFGQFDSALTLYDRVKNQTKPSQFAATQLISICKDPEIKKKLLSDIETHHTVDYRVILNLLGNHVREENIEGVKEDIEVMERHSIRLDNKMVSKLLGFCRNMRNPAIGNIVIEQMKKDRVEPDSPTGQAMTRFYIMNKMYDEVEELFREKGENFDDGVHLTLLNARVRDPAVREKLYELVRPNVKQPGFERPIEQRMRFSEKRRNKE